MIRVWSLLVVVMWSIPILAGDWQPNPDVRNELTIPQDTPAASAGSEDLWVDSLVRNLREGGANPDYVYRFSRSVADYKINGKSADNEVYVNRQNANIFLIIEETDRPFAKFVVNFGTNEVSAYQFGNSVFIPPSRDFCVVVLDYETSTFAGIPVRGGSDNPRFEGTTAYWY